MKHLFHFVLLFTLIGSYAQEPVNPMAFGTVHTLYSKIINEERKIFIYNPRTAEHDTLSGMKRYPVIYLLDAGAHFEALVGMIRELSWTGVLPEMIVVAISNTDRTRDLTPSHVSKASALDKSLGWHDHAIQTSGGGENFAAFIEKELVPHVDSLYPTAPYRLLIGHSFGGITVMNILLNHPHIFNSYIAIDPAFFWDDQKILKQAERDLARNKFEDKKLFFAMANMREAGMERIPLEKDTNTSGKIVSFNFRLRDALVRNKQNRLQWESKYYKNDDHGSVPLIAEYDGLRFIFDAYKFPLLFLEKIKAIKMDSAYTAHYKKVSEQMGYRVTPSQMVVSGMAYYLLSLKLFENARRLFQLNLNNYPDNWFVYDCMGDCCKEMGESEKAIEYYNKALTFFNHPDTKAKLAKLKTGTDSNELK